MALLDRRQLDERKLAVQNGQENAGLGYGGVAGRAGDSWMSAGAGDWETVALLDGRQLDERRKGGRWIRWRCRTGEVQISRFKK